MLHSIGALNNLTIKTAGLFSSFLCLNAFSSPIPQHIDNYVELVSASSTGAVISVNFNPNTCKLEGPPDSPNPFNNSSSEVMSHTFRLDERSRVLDKTNSIEYLNFIKTKEYLGNTKNTTTYLTPLLTELIVNVYSDHEVQIIFEVGDTPEESDIYNYSCTMNNGVNFFLPNN